VPPGTASAPAAPSAHTPATGVSIQLPAVQLGAEPTSTVDTGAVVEQVTGAVQQTTQQVTGAVEQTTGQVGGAVQQTTQGLGLGG
jgi:hypothetical protein